MSKYIPREIVKGRWVLDFKETEIGSFSCIKVHNVRSWRFRNGTGIEINHPYMAHSSIDDFISSVVDEIK